MWNVRRAAVRAALLGIICAAAPASLLAEGAGRKSETLEIPSAVLHETRTAHIYLPPGYEGSSERYPVLYKLDGESDILLFVSTLDSLAAAGRIPRIILVAIDNTNRRRDMTPTAIPGNPRTGEAGYFLAFIRRELVPAVEARCRATDDRILFGHSLAGLLVTYAFLAEPDLFSRWIATSASIPYDLRRLLFLAGESFQKREYAGAAIYLATGTEDLRGYLDAARTLSSYLETDAPADLRWKFEPLEGATHRSAPSAALGRALLFLYPDG